MSIEDRRTDKWQQQVESLGRPYTLSLRQAPAALFGRGAWKISDHYRRVRRLLLYRYTDDLSRFVDKVLSLLEVGGGFYTLVPGVHLEDGKDKLGVFYLTELENDAFRPERVCSWLKKTTCAKVVCESKPDWDSPTELINIRKVCSDISVPRVKLLQYQAGYPPGGDFSWSPSAKKVDAKPEDHCPS